MEPQDSDSKRAEQAFAAASDANRRTRGKNELRQLQDTFWIVLTAYLEELESLAKAVARYYPGDTIDLAKSTLSEAVLKAFQHVDTFDTSQAKGPKPFKSWFGAIFKNTLKGRSRRGARMVSLDNETIEVLDGQSRSQSSATEVPLEKLLDDKGRLRRLAQQARTGTQKGYLRGLFLVGLGYTWVEAHAELDLPGHPDNFRNAALRWARSVLLQELPPRAPRRGV